jgi:hypothetical protein
MAHHAPLTVVVTMLMRRALEVQAGQNGAASEPPARESTARVDHRVPETVAGSTPAAPVGH